jgi:RyR domain
MAKGATRYEALTPKPAASAPEDNVLGYEPKPIDTARVELSDDIFELTERLAENAHDVWAKRRMSEGWRYGPRRDEVEKTHPSLVPYEELPESEKEYDRSTAMETLKVLLALGYRIDKAS